MAQDIREKALKTAVVVTVLSIFSGSVLADDWSVVDKNIAQLEAAYTGGLTTTTSVVDQYLARITQYNKTGGGDGTLGDGGMGINAVAEVNPNIQSDAAAVEALILSGATTAQYPLLGVPVLVKDSYDVAGLITTNGVSILNGSGTPGSTTDIPTDDAFAIAQIKAAGGIIIGKANMSTMAYSFDGIDNAGGVVVNPYNPMRTPGGSSSGIGAGIASQFAMLGMGGETGGSIRIPSNADSDVGLKTSAGLIDPSGTFPLTPSRDVVGPIAKTVTDVAYAMNALVKPSTTNLWTDTPYYPSTGAQPGSIGTGLGEGSDGANKGLTSITGTRPLDYTTFLNPHALQGKVIAVENDAIGVGTAYDGNIAAPVATAFQNALQVMRNEGATIVFVNLPATVTYYTTIGASKPTTAGFPYPYPVTTVGGTTPSSTWSNFAAAYYYEKEIESENDPVIKNLDDFAAALAAGNTAKAGSKFSTLASAASNIASLAKIYDAGQAAGFGDANGDGILDNPDANEALQAFTSLRQDQFDAFMANPKSFDSTITVDHIDAFVAPTYGTVMPYVAKALQPSVSSTPFPTDPYATAGGASLMDRFEGNILGLPALSVPDGYTSDGTPMGIQFISQLDSEAKLIGFGFDYEQASDIRVDPDLSFTQVPEPASLSMLVVAAGALFTRRRRSNVA
jgi:amidase